MHDEPTATALLPPPAAGAVEAIATVLALSNSFGFGGPNAVLCLGAAA